MIGKIKPVELSKEEMDKYLSIMRNAITDISMYIDEMKKLFSRHLKFIRETELDDFEKEMISLLSLEAMRIVMFNYLKDKYADGGEKTLVGKFIELMELFITTANAMTTVPLAEDLLRTYAYINPVFKQELEIMIKEWEREKMMKQNSSNNNHN